MQSKSPSVRSCKNMPSPHAASFYALPDSGPSKTKTESKSERILHNRLNRDVDEAVKEVRGVDVKDGLCFGELYCVMVRLGFYRKGPREGSTCSHEAVWRLLWGEKGGGGRGELVSIRRVKAFCSAVMGVAHDRDEAQLDELVRRHRNAFREIIENRKAHD